MLRDRFVSGVRDERLVKCLLTQPEDKLTFTKAVELAKTYTQAEEHAKEMNMNSGTAASASVHKFKHKGQSRNYGSSSNTQKQRNERCYRCNQTTHTSTDCWAKDKQCFYCQNKGHVKGACKKFARDKASGKVFGANYVTEHAPRDSDNNVSSNTSVGEQGTTDQRKPPASASPYGMYQLHTPGRVSAPLMTTMLINNSDIVMEVDTGSGFAIISEEKYNEKLGGQDTEPLIESDYTHYKLWVK
jgi:hypothetical protein